MRADPNAVLAVAMHMAMNGDDSLAKKIDAEMSDLRLQKKRAREDEILRQADAIRAERAQAERS